MSPTKTKADFLELALKSGLVTQQQIDELFGSNLPTDANVAANQLLKAGVMTPYQAKQLLAGKFRGYFLGTYKILQPIGQGGMGSVFLAEHTSLQRRVAIKVLTAEKAKDKLTLERFNREARAAAALDHPNIVRLHDISQGNGVHFLVMEYVEGNDLHSLMSKTGPLHYAQAAQYIAQAAAGLQHAHDRGFIHRDIKPANLMLNKDGHIKILDMGLARNFNSDNDNLTAILAEGNIAGTVDFLSPEQAMNHPLDERSDIYSLGATFYALLTGHPPFNGSTAQKLMQHQLKDPPSVMKKLNGRLPPPLSDVLNKMMAKKPSERYQSATDVVDALAPWLPARTTGDIIQDGQPSGAMNYSQSTRNLLKSKSRNNSKQILADGTPLPLWQRKPFIIAAGVLVLAIIGGLCAMLLSGSKELDVAKTDNVKPPFTSHPGGVQNNTQLPTKPSPATPTNMSASPRGWKVIHKDDFAKVKPVQKMTNYTEGFSGDNIRRQAPGWQYEVYEKDSDGEFVAGYDNGVGFIGIGARSGHAASQLSYQPLRDETIKTTANTEYKVVFEYITEAAVVHTVSAQSVDPFNSIKSAQLKPASGWTQGSLEFTSPASNKFQICFRQNATSDKGFLKVRNFVLLEKAASAILAAFYAKDLTPFETKNASTELDIGWPGWFTNTYDNSVVARYVAKDHGDGMALGVAIESGSKNAGQITFRHKDSKVTLEDNVPYMVKLTYKTDPGGQGFVTVQTIGDWLLLNKVDLPDTKGTWKTVQVPMQKPVGNDIQFVFGPTTLDNKFVWVRSVEMTSDGEQGADIPAGNGMFTFKADSLTDFLDRGRTDVKSGQWKWESLGKSGSGSLPANWTAYPWRTEDICEYGVESSGGKKAVFFRTVEGQGSAMLILNDGEWSTDRLRLTVEYKTDPGANLFVRYKHDRPIGTAAVDVGYFFDTKGEWKTVSLDYAVKSGTAGKFEFHNNHGASKTIHIANITVTDANATKTNSNKQIKPLGKLLQTLELTTTTEQRAKFQDGKFLDDKSLPLIDHVGIYCWKKTSVAEFRTSTVEGSSAVGVMNLNDDLSSQIRFSLKPELVKTGKKYVAKIHYLTQNDTAANFVSQFGKDYKRGAFVSLPVSNDRWNTAFLRFDCLDSDDACLMIENQSVGEGMLVYVRKVEIYEED